MCHFHSLCNVPVICWRIVPRTASLPRTRIAEIARPVKEEYWCSCITPHTCKGSSVECGRHMKGALLHRLGSGISLRPGHELEAKSQPHFAWPPSPTAVMATVAGTNCCYGAMLCFYPPPLFFFLLLWLSATQQCAQVAFIHLITLMQPFAAMLSPVDKHRHIQAARQNLWLASDGEEVTGTYKPNAMNHQIFGFYAANPGALACITPHNKLSHLRFPVAG